MDLIPAKSHSCALTEENKAAVRQQLARLLDSPYFRHSKRFPTILRFVVEETLAGRADDIKERTLGVELFARKPDYEAATDPIVRVAAAEIRKRLAQYYMEPKHADELRINVSPGSYIPTFEWPHEASNIDSEPGSAEYLRNGNNVDLPAVKAPERISDAGAEAKSDCFDGLETEPHEPVKENTDPPLLESIKSRPVPRGKAIFLGTAPVILAVIAALIVHNTALSPVDFFWGPIQKGNGPVLICVADQVQASGVALRDTTDPSRVRWFDDPQKLNAFTTVALDNVEVVAKVVEVLHSKNRQYFLKSEATTNLDDLRSGPDVFIGGFDNAWTLRMTNSLRFRFTNEPDMDFPRIMDTENPTKPGWKIDPQSVGTNGTYHDYGIVARFSDDNTGTPVVVIAGIGRCASLAAGELISSPDDLAALERAAHYAGDKKNLEVVLSTQVINGYPGTPKIEATYFW